MSRDAIADVLGQLDYGDAPDEVERDLRLQEVDGLLTAGVVVDVTDLLIGGAEPLWHDARRTLHPLGWRPVVASPANDLTLCWAPPGCDQRQVEASSCPYVTAEAYGDGSSKLVYWPMYPTDPDVVGADIQFFGSCAELLTWLGTP